MRITVGDKTLSPGTQKMELLLRTLLIRKSQVVSLEQLTTELWGTTPPVRAVASLHVYVSQLRKIFDKACLNRNTIVTRTPGYALNLENDELDLDIFLAMLDKANVQMSVQQYGEAADTLSDALSLWREPIAASSYEGPIIREFANWSEELRIECAELLALSLIASDQANKAVRILYALISEHPLREEFYRLLMEALSKSGRRADALDIYQSARKLIRDELGLEPCRSLKETQQRILNDEINEFHAVRVPS